MRIGDNDRPGWCRPGQELQVLLAREWNSGTSVRALRNRQWRWGGIALLMGLLRAGDGDAGAGLAAGIAILTVFSPMLLLWNSQIRNIRRIGTMLETGTFLVTTAEGERAFPNRWSYSNLGSAHAITADGKKWKHVRIPYFVAERLKNRKTAFPAWLVMIDGEDTPILFPRQ